MNKLFIYYQIISIYFDKGDDIIMRKSILIVEDELRIRFLLRDYLMKEDYNVFEASNGEEGLFMFSTQKIDLVLLDIMMPIMDGLTMLEKLREVSTVPVILLTAKGEEEDKLQGYDYGADDYITKPFSPKVLIAKVKALLKRTREDLDSSSQDFNGLTVNKLSHEVKIDGKEIILSPKEYELLIYLITNESIALSRDNILDNVWGIDYYGDIRTVDTNVKRLREKLLDKANYIVTVRGSGYKFEGK
jgi:DNA-binding response OmpR family regulator